MPHVSPGVRPLPAQPTTFIGREAELAEIDRLLADPACRALTLAGPGGVGKTRRALASAARNAHRFADGVGFVELQSVSAAEEAPPAIASALGIPARGGADAASQLAAALQHRQMLLLLDNFDHLVAGAAQLSELLAAAPRVKLLVTSRKALRIQEEWRYPLDGLRRPGSTSLQRSEVADAVALFVERARRARADFSLAAEYDGVARICDLTEGLPLAIELAAAWVTALPCAAIAAEIERDLSLLTTDMQNLPERHRSVRAAFDHSWRLLPPHEQAALARLAVFRSGFPRDAASAVAGATLPVLAALVAKSLLRFEADGRYHLHELVRRYAWEHLQSDPEERDRVLERYQDHYLSFLATKGAAMAGGQQSEALRELVRELDNVRFAWQLALDRGDVEAILPGIWALGGVYHFRGRYREGLAALEQTIDRLRGTSSVPAGKRALAAALREQGMLQTRVGALAEAVEALSEAQSRYAQLGELLPPGMATDPEIGLGVLALAQGDYAAAARRGATVRQQAEREGHVGNLPYGWYLIAQVAMARGRTDEAQQAARRAEAAARRSGDEWFRAYCLNDLGAIAAASGEHERAQQFFRASLALRETLGDPEGVAVALVHLGNVALLQQDFAASHQRFSRAYAIYRDIGDRGGLAAALHGLGVAAAGSGDLDASAEHLSQALRVTREIGFTPLALTIGIDAADVLFHRDQNQPPAEILPRVYRHPAASLETRERAEHLLHTRTRGPRSEQTEAAAEGRRTATLAALVASLRNTLQVTGAQDGKTLPRPPANSGQVQPQIEPLTERELAVLRLIAAGRTNRQIADELFIAVSTVKWYASQILAKLDVANRTSAVARARELGLLT